MKSRRLTLALTVLAARLLFALPLMADVQWAHGISYGMTAAPLYTLDALQTATDRFLGRPEGGGGNRSGFGGSGSGRVLSKFIVVPGPQAGAWISMATRLSPNLEVRAQGEWLVALSSVRFPDGIDVFTDPARLRLSGQSLRGELALDWGQHWQISAGAGVELAWVHAHVTSALLDVRSVTRTAQVYGLLGFGHDLPDGLRFTANLRFNSKDANLEVGILTRF